MIQMNLFPNQKQTHRHRKQTDGYQKRQPGGNGKDKVEFDINICALIFLLKNIIRIFLVGIALNLLMSLSRMNILTVLLLTTHGHVISFHLFVFSSVSFTSLVKLIPKDFFTVCFWKDYRFYFIFLIVYSYCIQVQLISIA